MALTLSRNDLPGVATAQKWLASPAGEKFKKALLYVGIGIVALGVIALGGWGIAALIGAAGGTILSGVLVAGVITGLGFLFSFLGKTIPQLYQFNWQISDAEIKNSIKSKMDALYGQLGEAAGTATGWLLCGILPGTLTFAFNPGVARLVMEDMTEEARDEVWGNIAGVKQGVVGLLGSALIGQGFMSARRWLKRPDSPFYNFLKEHFGEGFTKWGDANQKSWSFASATEERIEKIKDPGWRNFTEEFVDGLLDGCSEALQNLGQSMRQQMAAYTAVRKREQMAATGQMVVQLDFSRDDNEAPPAPTP